MCGLQSRVSRGLSWRARRTYRAVRRDNELSPARAVFALDICIVLPCHWLSKPSTTRHRAMEGRVWRRMERCMSRRLNRHNSHTGMAQRRQRYPDIILAHAWQLEICLEHSARRIVAPIHSDSEHRRPTVRRTRLRGRKLRNRKGIRGKRRKRNGFGTKVGFGRNLGPLGGQ